MSFITQEIKASAGLKIRRFFSGISLLLTDIKNITTNRVKDWRRYELDAATLAFNPTQKDLDTYEPFRDGRLCKTAVLISRARREYQKDIGTRLNR